MDGHTDELLEKIRQQFSHAPYPNIPLEKSPKDSHAELYRHNLVTPYYLRNQRLLSTEGKVILDAGCGSGYKSLTLAEANPGAKIIGIDLVQEAVDLARSRLKFYNFDNAEFFVAAIEDLPSLGIEFDYINCDKVLYLLPDIAQGLQIMKSVLKPEGLIRANLHSSLQRSHFFRAQQIFHVMGLMDGNPEDMEIELAREMFRSLKDWVALKIEAWKSPAERQVVNDKEWVLMNYLFQGDKGYTIPELFAALRSADLEFISMVNWRQWELLDLFNDADDLPPFLAMSLPGASTEQKLQLFELLHPVHRLLDFWCGHPNQAQPALPVSEWSATDWQHATVHLHPQLRVSAIREDLGNCIQKGGDFIFDKHLPIVSEKQIKLDRLAAARLLPLWDEPQSVQALVDRSLKLQPFDLLTLEPVSPEIAKDTITALLETLEVFTYVLLEHSIEE